MTLRPPHFLTILLLFFRPLVASAAEPKAGGNSWNAFGDPGTEAPAPGAIRFEPNASMNFERGVSAQAIYVVDGTVEAAAQALNSLDPTRYPELEVYQQRSFHAEAEARFSELKIDPKTPPFQALLGEMTAPKHLQLTPDELARLPRKKDPTAAQIFWAAALRERWNRFSRDGQWSLTGSFDGRADLRSLLREEPKIAAHFAALFQPIVTPGSAPAAEYYWDVSNTQGLANFELGAIFERTEGEVRQVADVTYYSSSGYIAAVSLFEFSPLAGRTTPQTLVWQGTLLSSAEIAGALGLKRKFAIRTVETEMRQWIGIFRRACAGEKK